MDGDSDGGTSTSTLEISQPETQFVPQEDDVEILWEVIEITAEKGKQYRVRWAGTDPKTRKPWPQSWVPKHDCTDDLVLAWKRKQALKKKGAGRGKCMFLVSLSSFSYVLFKCDSHTNTPDLQEISRISTLPLLSSQLTRRFRPRFF